MRLFHGKPGRDLKPLQVNDQHAGDRITDERGKARESARVQVQRGNE